VSLSLIRLLAEDVHVAEWVGEERERRASRRGWQRNDGKAGQDIFEDHRSGAAAEYAVALALGVTWRPSLEPDKLEGDVLGLHVRATSHDHGHLVLHKPIAQVGRRDGDPDGTFVLVTGTRPWLTVRGWIKSDIGRDRAWWGRLTPQSRRPCFKVPQSALRPVTIRLARRESLSYELPAGCGYPEP
jgi:hypothetical protein